MIDPPSNDPDVGLADVVEITAAPLKRGPGRPKKIEAAPQEADLAFHASVIEAKARFMDADDLVASLRGRHDAREVLQRIMVGLAREAAALEFQRIELEKRGRDPQMISGRRVDCLRKLAELQLRRREMDLEHVNLSGEAMQKVFSYWVECTLEVARDVMPPELVDIFSNRLATKLKDFEEQAENRLR